MKKIKNFTLNNYDKLILFLFILYVIYKSIQYGLPTIYSWDLFGSYIYLPMCFDQHNLNYNDLNYFQQLNEKHQLSNTLYQFVLNDNGKIMTKYTVGWSILMTPFYLIAEFWAYLFNFKTDGFSFPYKFMIYIGNIFYFISSIFILRKVLHIYFNVETSLILIAILFLGTNFMYSQYAALGSTHLIEFFLVCCLLYQTHRFYSNITFLNGILLSILIALIFLVRPPDIILALIPIMWTNDKFPKLKTKIKLIFYEKSKMIVLMIITFVLLISIQFVYWRITSGYYLINSYANNSGEGFDWLTPYTLEFLFSFRKGWFLYTPLGVLMLIGFYFWIKKESQGKLFLFIIILYIFVISCWTTWWYATSYSQRAVLEIYPILLISFGFLLKFIFESKILILKAIFTFIVSFCIFLNLIQSYQIEKGILHGDRMSKAYYFSTFLQLKKPSSKQLKLLQFDRNKFYLENEKIDQNEFKFIKKIKLPINTTLKEIKNEMDPISIPKNQLSFKPYFLIKFRWFYSDSKSKLKNVYFDAATTHKKKEYSWFCTNIDLPNFIHNSDKKYIDFFYITPHFRNNLDKIKTKVWIKNNGEITVKKLEISIFEPKIVYE